MYSKVRQLYIYVATLFQILLPYRLLQNTEYSSLCYTVGPCWLSILNIAVSTCQSQTTDFRVHYEDVIAQIWKRKGKDE